MSGPQQPSFTHVVRWFGTCDECDRMVTTRAQNKEGDDVGVHTRCKECGSTLWASKRAHKAMEVKNV